jgi:hypothetical protein
MRARERSDNSASDMSFDNDMGCWHRYSCAQDEVIDAQVVDVFAERLMLGELVYCGLILAVALLDGPSLSGRAQGSGGDKPVLFPAASHVAQHSASSPDSSAPHHLSTTSLSSISYSLSRVLPLLDIHFVMRSFEYPS